MGEMNKIGIKSRLVFSAVFTVALILTLGSLFVFAQVFNWRSFNPIAAFGFVVIAVLLLPVNFGVSFPVVSLLRKLAPKFNHQKFVPYLLVALMIAVAYYILLDVVVFVANSDTFSFSLLWTLGYGALFFIPALASSTTLFLRVHRYE